VDARDVDRENALWRGYDGNRMDRGITRRPFIPACPARPSLPIALVLMTPASKSTFVLGHRHLLGIEGLSAADITGLLDLSEEYVELNRQVDKKRTSLRGRTQVNLFFEASTRTNPRSKSPASGWVPTS